VTDHGTNLMPTTASRLLRHSRTFTKGWWTPWHWKTACYCAAFFLHCLFINFSPGVQLTSVNALRDSNSLKPVRRAIQGLFNHAKSIQVKTGFSWNMNGYDQGKSKGNSSLELLKICSAQNLTPWTP